jgi:CRISPR-associated protein Csx17
MSRVLVQYNPRADLLNDLDRRAWLPSFRRFARGANAPARLQSLTLRLDEAIFAMMGGWPPLHGIDVPKLACWTTN